MSASETLGLDLTLNGLMPVINGLLKVQQALADTAKAQGALFSSRGRLRGSITPANVGGMLSGAEVTTNGPGAKTSISGNRMKIEITVRGGGGGPSKANGKQPRTSGVPALIKDEKVPGGPRQRRVALLRALGSAEKSGNTAAQLDVMDAIRSNEKRIKAAHSPEANLVAGPHQRKEHLQEALRYAENEGNIAKRKDILTAIRRNDKQIAAANPAKKTFGGAVKTALLSSRFGADGIMPLVSKTMEALETLGPEMGIVGVAAMALGKGVTEAASAVMDFAKRAADAGNDFAKFGFTTGASTATNAKLLTLGAAGGLTQAEIGSAAQQLQDRISSDPIAMAYGAKAGIRNFAGPFGNQDIGTQTVKYIEALRKMTPDERQRSTGATGTRELLPLTNISDKTWNLLKGADAQTKADTMSPAQITASAEFQVSTARVQEAIQNLVTAASPAVLNALSDFFNRLASIINAIADFITKHEGLITGILSAAGATVDIATGGAFSAGNSLLGMGADQHDKQVAATEKNTAATEKNTAAMGMPGAYGNVSRGGSLPESFNGEKFRHAQDMGGYHLSTI